MKKKVFKDKRQYPHPVGFAPVLKGESELYHSPTPQPRCLLWKTCGKFIIGNMLLVKWLYSFRDCIISSPTFFSLGPAEPHLAAGLRIDFSIGEKLT